MIGFQIESKLQIVQCPVKCGTLCYAFQSASWERLYWTPSWNPLTAFRCRCCYLNACEDWVEGSGDDILSGCDASKKQTGEAPSWLRCSLIFASFPKSLHQNVSEWPPCRLFFFQDGTRATVVKQVGTVSCESDVLKMSVITSAGRLACVLRIQPAKLSGSASLIFTPSRLFSHIHSGYFQWPVFWRQSQPYSWLFVREMKDITKCV